MSLTKSLQKSSKHFGGMMKKTFRKPTAGHVHDLRVLTRRLRTDFWLVPKAERTKDIRKVRRELERLAKVLGEQRKYDVAQEDAAHYMVGTKEIKHRLHEARASVRKALIPKRRKSCIAHLKRAIRDTNGIAVSSFVPRIASLRSQLVRSAEHPPRDRAARHLLRIRVKKARYLLEAFSHEIPKLNSLQEHMGRWHDLMVLSDLAGQPKKVIEAGRREWLAAERGLQSTLSQTDRVLASLGKSLRG